jgi:hypothetical protein
LLVDEQALAPYAMKTVPPNKITGANAGGARQLTMRTRWAARVAQFCRSAATHGISDE